MPLRSRGWQFDTWTTGVQIASNCRTEMVNVVVRDDSGVGGSVQALNSEAVGEYGYRILRASSTFMRVPAPSRRGHTKAVLLISVPVSMGFAITRMLLSEQYLIRSWVGSRPTTITSRSGIFCRTAGAIFSAINTIVSMFGT